MFAAKNELLTRPNGGYNLTRSLRFRSSASAYLNRTPAAASNRQKWTWSGWVKRGVLGNVTQGIFGSNLNSTTGIAFGFSNGASAGDYFFYTINGVGYAISSSLYRDPSAWYQVVIAFDSTQAAAADRCIVYINNSRLTFGSNIVVQNNNYDVNNTTAHNIGFAQGLSNYFDGYMAEVNFIDGQALAPTAFGEFSPYNQWLPKKYAGSYGTNGFRLPFTNNASTTTLGYDFSPQGNNWTTNNISVTAGATYDSMTDVPTLTSATAANYCTLNPLQAGNPPSNGNLSATTSGTAHRNTLSTMYFSTGAKFYYEISVPSIQRVSAGLATSALSLTSVATGQAAFSGIYGDSSGSNVYNGVTLLFSQGAIAANDVYQFCIDASTGNAWFGRNNTFYSSAGAATGNPATGANPTFTGLTLTNYSPEAGVYDAGTTASANFGQRPFSYTPPSGFVALNTFNL